MIKYLIASAAMGSLVAVGASLQQTAITWLGALGGLGTFGGFAISMYILIRDREDRRAAAERRRRRRQARRAQTDDNDDEGKADDNDDKS